MRDQMTHLGAPAGVIVRVPRRPVPPAWRRQLTATGVALAVLLAAAVAAAAALLTIHWAAVLACP